jgi:hypothetical protein
VEEAPEAVEEEQMEGVPNDMDALFGDLMNR